MAPSSRVSASLLTGMGFKIKWSARLGFCGREEGIAAMASVLLSEPTDT